MMFKFLTAISIALILTVSNSWKKEDKMAKASVLGYNITNTKGFNNRVFERKRIENFRRGVKTVIFGSSRAMKISKEVLKHKNFQNLGISSGVLNDVYGLYYLYATNFFHPEEVILVVDPWFLLDRENDARWQKAYKMETQKMRSIIEGKTRDSIKTKDRSKMVFSTKLEEIYPLSEFYFKENEFQALKENQEQYKEYCNMLKSTKISETKKSKINKILKIPNLYDKLSSKSELFLSETGNQLVLETENYRRKKFKRLKYFQKLNRLIFELNIGLESKKNSDEIITNEKSSTQFSMISDGTIAYTSSFENSTLEEINKRAQKRGLAPFLIPANTKFENQKMHKDIFEKFIFYLKQQNVKVSIVMIPYHPHISSKLATIKYSFAKEVETYLKEFGKLNTIKVIGSYFPGMFNLDEEDFYDDVHIRKSGLKKLGFN